MLFHHVRAINQHAPVFQNLRNLALQHTHVNGKRGNLRRNRAGHLSVIEHLRILSDRKLIRELSAKHRVIEQIHLNRALLGSLEDDVVIGDFGNLPGQVVDLVFIDNLGVILSVRGLRSHHILVLLVAGSLDAESRAQQNHNHRNDQQNLLHNLYPP